MIVDGYSPAMLRWPEAMCAAMNSPRMSSRETWIGVIKGLNGFQGRSSLRTWIFTVLINTAKKRGGREHREQQARAADARRRHRRPAQVQPGR